MNLKGLCMGSGMAGFEPTDDAWTLKTLRDGAPWNRMAAGALALVERLQAELAEARRDAERYRFMRESYDADLWTRLGRVGCDRERMDAEIDMAIRALGNEREVRAIADRPDEMSDSRIPDYPGKEQTT
jgi:hypothetical protein